MLFHFRVIVVILLSIIYYSLSNTFFLGGGETKAYPSCHWVKIFTHLKFKLSNVFLLNYVKNFFLKQAAVIHLVLGKQVFTL